MTADEEQAARELYGDRVVNAYLWLLAADRYPHDSTLEASAVRLSVACLLGAP